MSMMTQKDKWIPWYFVLFFVIVATVNAIMVTFALTTTTGTITDHPYEKGIAYNRIVEAEQKQEKLGWKAQIELKGTTLQVVLKDAKGLLLKPEKLVAHFTRPTQDGMDFDVPLTNGQAQVHFPIPGNWEVRVFAVVGKDTYQQSKRIIAE